MASKLIPTQMRQIMVKQLGNNFRAVTEIVQVPVPKPGAKQALVKTSYVAINASDILFSSGWYTPGVKPPFPAGLEAMGEIVAVGEGSQHKVGQNVAFSKFGSFSEYLVVEDNLVVPVPSNDPVVLSLAVSGATASLALEKKCELKDGQNVLITAAAGATGQFAVQIAKQKGCHVIGTCSSQEKADFLKSIGCDRPVIYTKESLDEVLKKEYPKGVDIVYESVGNEMFDTALKNIAVQGKIIIIGAISGYEGEKSVNQTTTALPVPFMALQKSADVVGFFMPHFREDIPSHIAKLAQQIASGQIKAAVDKGDKSEKGPFRGLEAIYDAVDYMYAKKNTGKVVIAVNNSGTSAL